MKMDEENFTKDEFNDDKKQHKKSKKIEKK